MALRSLDLMIGDWVLYDGEPNMITEVSEIIHGEATVCFVGNNYMANLDEIEPIPITPEVLGKNGFKRDPIWHHCDKVIDNYSILVQLGYANKIEYIRITENGKDNVIPSERTKMYMTHIKYVHELQHSMRLCGIDKEIIL